MYMKPFCNKSLKLLCKYLIFLLVAFQINLAGYGFIHNSHKAKLANHTPVFTNTTYSYTVADDIAVNGLIGAVAATDVDGGKLIYSFKSGNTNHSLSIDSLNGKIRVAKHLNHHTQDSFFVTVRATDPGHLSGEASVTIVVTLAGTSQNIDSINWQTAPSQPFGTHEVHGEVVNGKLYVFGGYDVQKRPKYIPTKRAFVYDPVPKTWTPIADLPHTPKGTGFGGITHEGLATDGTDIYFAGGYPCNASGTAQAFGTKQVWRYNVSSNTYTALPDLPLDLATGQLRYLKGKLHYMGGANKARHDTSVHYALDLDNLAAGWKVLAPILNATNHPGSAVFENKIYFIGGAHHQDAASIKQKTVEVYDPATNTWKLLSDMPVQLDHISSAVVIIGKNIIVLGGEVKPNSKSKQVFAYSPADDTWASLTPMPVERSAGVAAFIDGALYYTGGNFTKANRRGTLTFRTGNQLNSLILMNADTDQPIKALSNGDTLNLALLPTRNLNIVANTFPAKVGSVQFNLTGALNTTVIESKAPYALFGDDGNGDFKPWTPSLGNYTLKATPYSGTGATGAQGTGKTVNFTVTDNATQNLILSPIADAFIRDGNFANTNYGIDTSVLEVKTSPSSGFNRYTYLKFSLNGIKNITKATLRIFGRNTNNTQAISVSCYGVNDNSWGENTITFNNAPAPLSFPLSYANVTDTVKYYEFDVTGFAKVHLNGDKLITLMLKDPARSDKNLVFNSRENAANLPQLVIADSSQKKITSNLNDGHGNDHGIHLPGKSDEGKVLYDGDRTKTKIYPNPAHNVFTIEFANNLKGTYNLQIVDPVGRIYELGRSELKQGANTTTIDVSELFLKKGIYFLRIQPAAMQSEIIKLIIE